MTKTEKLHKKIDKLMRKAVGSGWWTYQTNEILKVCKESGLEFVSRSKTSAGVSLDTIEVE